MIENLNLTEEQKAILQNLINRRYISAVAEFNWICLNLKEDDLEAKNELSILLGEANMAKTIADDIGLENPQKAFNLESE